jgi:hypothetical protein
MTAPGDGMPPPGQAASQAPARPAAHPAVQALLGLLFMAGTVGGVFGLALVLRGEAFSRPESNAPAAAAAPAAPAPEEALPPPSDFAAARTRLKLEPDNVGLAAAVGHGLLAQEDLQEAAVITQQALQRDPFHTEHRVHAEMLRGMRGEVEPALEVLERIGRAQPDGAEALLFAGGLALELGDSRRALGNFEAYRATVPPGESPPRLEQVIADLRMRLDGAGATPR